MLVERTKMVLERPKILLERPKLLLERPKMLLERPQIVKVPTSVLQNFAAAHYNETWCQKVLLKISR